MREIESCTLLDLSKPFDNAPCKGMGSKTLTGGQNTKHLVTLFCNILRDLILPESFNIPFTVQKPFPRTFAEPVREGESGDLVL